MVGVDPVLEPVAVVAARGLAGHRERPYGGAFDKLLPEIFEGGLYSWSPIGSPNELRASTVSELQDFWNKYYVPNNATVIVAGDIDHANVQALARKYFGWMPRFPDAPAPSVDPR